MATALDFVKSALRKGGILSKTEDPSSDEASDALEVMNDMIESWATSGLTVPYKTLESFTLTSGTSSYTIGSSGSFNTVRPVKIVSCYVNDGSTDSNVRQLSEEDYAAIQLKTDSGTPENFSYNQAYPLGIIRFYPTPDQSFTVNILTEKKIGSYALGDTISLPEGWARAIKNNLAVELCAEYGVSIPQETVSAAADSMAAIKRAVAKNTPMDAFPKGSEANIYSGYND